MRLLMLTYYYPPMGGAGVQRSLKFSRYLPEFGIAPTVVSAESDAYPHDPSLLRQIPAKVDVTRIPHTPALSRIVSLSNTLRRSPRASGSPSILPMPAKSVVGSALWRDRFLSAWAATQFPDDKAAWSREAVRASRITMARSPVDVVFSSSPPMSAHGAAMKIAGRARLPWVADFRDLWTGSPGYMAPAWRRAIDRRLEQRLVTNATGIVAVSAPIEAQLARMAGPNVPTICIPNGYDEDDFTGVKAAPREAHVYRIVHVGTFYGDRSPEPFLRGVERWLEESERLRDFIRVRFVGSIGSRFDATLTRFSERFPGVLQLTGYVDHARALSEVLGADALLLVVGGDGEAAAGVMTGKVFEYLRAARPILLVGPSRTEAARLIAEMNAGEVVDPQRPDEIAELLDRWVVHAAAPQPDPMRAAAFERRALTRRLADFLTGVHQRFHAENRVR